MVRKVISTDKAPKAIGPYSQGIIAGNFIFVSGQGAIDPITNNYTPSSIEKETEIALNNLKAILEESGSNLSNVVKVTVFLANMDDFPAFNKVYEKFFPEDPPARSCIEASKLPKGFKVEIEAIALISA
jgi:2-iminobutanoate/2-iminopropanoate deaminase